MSTLLTQRALRVFAVLENYRAGSPDILDALLPFFEPILAEFRGQTLNQEAFAARIRESYRWNFTADIVEELIPRFQNHGWVREVAHINNLPAYQIIYDNPIASPAGADEIKISEILINTAQEFKEFIDRLSPLTSAVSPVNELANTLVEWLVSIDAYSEDVLRRKAIQRTYIDGRLGLAVDLTDSRFAGQRTTVFVRAICKAPFRPKVAYHWGPMQACFGRSANRGNPRLPKTSYAGQPHKRKYLFRCTRGVRSPRRIRPSGGREHKTYNL